MDNNLQVNVKNCRVLIVEDSFLVCIHLQTLLEEHGYEIVGTTSTAEEAVSLAASLDPELVLMDINLAGEMNGIEAATIIRKNSAATVVYLSAISELQKIDLHHKEGSFHYVTKPFDDRQILQYLEEVFAASGKRKPV